MTTLGFAVRSRWRWSSSVIRTDHQIAQKLHALSSPGSDRARDLVDLQLLEAGEEINLAGVGRTCERLFAYRQGQPWPPPITIGVEWSTLYAAAAEGLDALPTVVEAVTWANDFVQRIANAG